jgi:hypothetical protein
MYAQVEKAKAELKAQSDAAKNELDRQKMALEAERNALELQQRAAKDASENRIAEAKLALQGLELQLKQGVADSKIQQDQLDSVMSAINQLHSMTKSGINQ